jgi:hypothetical protein
MVRRKKRGRAEQRGWGKEGRDVSTHPSSSATSGSGSGIRKIYFTKGKCFGSQCSGCGSGRIGIILPDPELDLHLGSGVRRSGSVYISTKYKEKRQIFIIVSKILKIMTPMALTRKIRK